MAVKGNEVGIKEVHSEDGPPFSLKSAGLVGPRLFLFFFLSYRPLDRIIFKFYISSHGK